MQSQGPISLSLTCVHLVGYFAFEHISDSAFVRMMPGEHASSHTGVGTIQNSKILDYIREHGDDISFTEVFWKDCEPFQYELERYPKYVKVFSLAFKGTSLNDICTLSGVKITSIRKWTSFAQKPKLAHYLEAYLSLGLPREGWTWLSINNTSGHAVPLGPFIQVPKEVTEWVAVADVLAQIAPLEASQTELSREYMFGFLLGIAIGDASKSRVGNWHRHLGLALSKRYATSERIGDFLHLCTQSWTPHASNLRQAQRGQKTQRFLRMGLTSIPVDRLDLQRMSGSARW